MSIQYFKSEKIITTNLLGSYNLNNILAAVCFGRVFNVEVENIFQSISKYEPSNNRSQLIKSKYNQIIADCYNANPTSTLAALKSFINTNFEKKLVILGDMLELGDQEEKEHQQIVHYLKKNNLTAILVGKCYQKSKNDFICFEKTEFLLDYLQNKNFRNHLILLKGSRGIKLESIINQNIL
jgi:UDP-N-acetylmuramoyl-tripeptide--D-alanyl-D-alanine ligase